MTTQTPAAQTPTRPADARIAPFLARANHLSTGDASALKRALGMTLSQAKAPAQAAFFKIAPTDIKPWEEDAFFLSACSVCAFGKISGAKHAFVDCLRALYQQSQGVERLFLSLLDAPWDEDGFLLGKFSRLLRRIVHEEMNVDQAELLRALLGWGAPARFVQLRWARAFYAGSANAQTTQNT